MFAKTCGRLLSEQKGVVPFAESLLCALETRGRPGGSFGGFGADLCQVPSSFGDLANGVKVLVLAMVQSAKSEGKPPVRYVLESITADREIERRLEGDLQAIEFAVNFEAIFFQQVFVSA